MKKISDIALKVKDKGLKHILFHTIPWKFNNAIDNFVFCVTKKIFIKAPLKEIIIIESHNDFDSNGGAFYDYLIENKYNENYKIVWFLRNDCPRDLPTNVIGFKISKPSFRKSYYYCVAKYIVCGHVMLPSMRSEQISYYTTHGGFSLKAFKGNVDIPEGMTYILTPIATWNPILADGYTINYPNDRMISIGFPVHDILYKKEPGDLRKITSKIYDKVILWMPTFRKSISGREDSSKNQVLGIPIFNSYEEFKHLNEKLAHKNVLLVIKIHPMQDMNDIKISSETNIVLLDGDSVKKLGIDNYHLMKDADALISDYSSSAYDYLHLNRPIGYTMDDAGDYKVGFLVDNPKDYMAGEIIYDYKDFCGFIDNVIDGRDSYEKKRKDIFYKIWEFRDGKSCERLAKHMKI